VSLFLIGMRGAGKTSAGARAAARLGVPHVDSDALVEARAGCTIAELFRDRGEPAFRALEREVLLAELPQPGRIVSTGGGCVLDPEVRAALRRSGRVVWLQAPALVLSERVRGSARPSLTGHAPEAELAAVLAAREVLYRECADETVETAARDVDEVADVIEQLWTLLPHHDLR
jgi:shikimate kinase